jgi:hypothetical protein
VDLLPVFPALKIALFYNSGRVFKLFDPEEKSTA